MNHKLTISIAFVLMVALLAPFPNAEGAGKAIEYYIDGQAQRSDGHIVEDAEGLWIPYRPILLNLKYINSDWELDRQTVNNYLRELRDPDKKPDQENEDKVEPLEELKALTIKQIDHRLMIHLSELKQLGFDPYFFQDARILHINTPNINEIAGLKIGDSRSEVNSQFTDVHWNTAYGQDADVIGFIGEMITYSYKDRYGYERDEQVPEIQVEVKNDQITYLFISSNDFPTSKGIRVGDQLREVYSEYGNQYVSEQADGKRIVVFDMEFGSIWFIANSNQEIERIAYLDHHVRGFGQSEDTSEDN